ncbi:MAG TPA: histidine phosphatase family protein [Aeromicrobium sp.]|nr:histidine phosphatase family protein [Aeromicrobium sp.]
MSRQLILWRHGRTEWNASGRVQGQSDVPLDDIGQQQAAVAAARLATLDPFTIVSSDLQRALRTAEILGLETGVSVKTDKRLREMHFGVREGLTAAEAWKTFPDEMRAWQTGDDIRMPGGETYREAGVRFAAALGDIAATLPADRAAVVVGHGAVLRVGACTFLGIPQAHWRSFGGFNNCAWSVLEQVPVGDREAWRISEWNAGTLPEPVLSDDT